MTVLTGGKENDKIDEMELNEILLNIIPIICSKQVYVQGFGCEKSIKNL